MAQNVPAGHQTLHMTPQAVWNAQVASEWYLPESFAADGFIHCTDSLEELVAVGNRYYFHDQRDYLALDIACDLVPSRVQYDDEQMHFPHIYGPLPIAAVKRIWSLTRDREGAFTGVEDND